MVNTHAPPGSRGEAMGFQQSSYAVGRVLGPPLAGSAFDRIGVWSPMLAASAVTALALLLFLSWRDNARVETTGS